MKANIQLRKATLRDRERLEYWDTKQHNIDADPNGEWDWAAELAEDPPWREQLIAELDGRPFGFIQIIDPAAEETHYWGEVPANLRAIDIWIGEEADIGKGYGTVMMQLAFERCFSEPAVTAILIDPLVTNTRAIRFYEKLGFSLVERRMFEEDDCFVYRISRTQWEKQRP
ncbi:MAG: GNAT family N-acetyltransferase [Bacteroidota bacterium]